MTLKPSLTIVQNVTRDFLMEARNHMGVTSLRICARLTKLSAEARGRATANWYAEANKELAENRRAQVGSGDRSERIRTYNFPQNRVTDHRINLTLYKLDRYVDGDLLEMIGALNAKLQEEAITKLGLESV